MCMIIFIILVHHHKLFYLARELPTSVKSSYIKLSRIQFIIQF